MDRKSEALAPLIMTARMMAQRPANVRAARQAGVKWSDISEALDMSQSQVIELSKK